MGLSLLTPDNIASPGNLIAGVNTNSFNCAGCLNQSDERVFFAVTAEYVPAVTAGDAESQDAALSAYSKADAVQSQIIENPHIYMTSENEEQAAPNK